MLHDKRRQRGAETLEQHRVGPSLGPRHGRRRRGRRRLTGVHEVPPILQIDCPAIYPCPAIADEEPRRWPQTLEEAHHGVHVVRGEGERDEETGIRNGAAHEASIGRTVCFRFRFCGSSFKVRKGQRLNVKRMDIFKREAEGTN